ncbi:hypothetical protein HMPREF9349_02638 [Escherichia coli MS 79-10]|nr:hypothetical protein HMPREF9349_02638 [Escherichia coli MS 79-10]
MQTHLFVKSRASVANSIFMRFCPNIYSSYHVLITGYRWKRNWD